MLSVENERKGFKSVQKDPSNETPTSSKLKSKTPRNVLKGWEESESSSDESNKEDIVDFEFSDISNNDYVVGQYAGKCNAV